MPIDTRIEELEAQASELRRQADKLSEEADRLRKQRLEAKQILGTATRSDVEAVHGTDACGYRW